MMWKIVLPVLAAVFAVGSGGLVGGFRDIDVNDAGVQSALNFSVVQHNKATNDMNLHQVFEVMTAQSQVVAGIRYVITVKMARTSCQKGSVNEECAIYTDPNMAKPLVCTFTVWNRPWLNKMEVTEKCSAVQQGEI